MSHRLRLALSGLAIVLGVAFVSGTMIFTDTLARTFDDLFNASAADVTVQPKAAFDVGLTGTGAAGASSTMPGSVIDRIAAIDGVAEVAGDVEAQGVYVLDKKGKVLNTGGAPGIGVNWVLRRAVSPVVLTEGRGPLRAGEIALDTGAVTKTGYRVGDAVQLLTPGPRITVRLVGIFKYGASGGLAGASVAAFDTATAQNLFGEPGRFTSASVSAASGVDDDALRSRIAQALGDGYDVKTQKQQAHALAAALAQTLQFISVFLLVFAGVALFVGTFIILNTFAMLVAQRQKELALLRALGASRGQVTRSILTEALILGIVGSTVGLGAGFMIATALRALFGVLGLTIDGSLTLSARTVLWSYAVGVIVTMVAAYLPARRAARIPPVAAMIDDFGTAEHSLRRRTIIGVALTVTGVGALAVSFVASGGNTAATWVGVGTVSLVIGAIALSSVLARPFLQTVGSVLPAFWGRTGRLARDNALRNPRRTAVTASALMVGLALVTGFSILGASAKASVNTDIDHRLRADFVISTAVSKPFTPAVAARVARVDGVGAVMEQRVGTALVDGTQMSLTAVDADVLSQTVALDYVTGSAAGLTNGGMLVDRPTADARGWAVGDTVPVLLPNGKHMDLGIGGVYESDQIIGSPVVALSAYEAAGGVALDQFVFVDLAKGADAGAVRAALAATVAQYPVVRLEDQGEFKAELSGQVDQLILLLDALLGLSVLIAGLGIMNTLALSVIERTHEIGLLRAIGMSRRQLRRMIILEAVIMSLFGALLGIVLGVAFGVSLTHALAGQGLAVLSIPAGRLVLFLGLAAVIGLVAALWPARRASRLLVLDAIASR